MANPREAIDITASDDGDDVQVIDLIDLTANNDDDTAATVQIPAWDDQTRVRPSPPGHTITQCLDLVRIAPDGTPRNGVVVGWMDLYMWTDVMEWLENGMEVAAYVNDNGGVEFRLVGEEGAMDEELFYWIPGQPGPTAGPITMKTVFGPTELGRTSWTEFWEAVRKGKSLREVKLLARSYIQVKNGGHWADPA
jgi:hypothetical protein